MTAASVPRPCLPPLLRARVAQDRPALTRAELAAAGVSDGQVRLWLRLGHLRRVSRGVYLIDAPIRGADPWSRREERHRRRCAAIVVAVPGSYPVGVSAALMHRLPVLDGPAEVHVAVRPYARHERPGARVHRPWGQGPVQKGPEVPTQCVAETVAEVSARAGGEAGLVVADAALYRGLVTRSELHEAVLRYGSRRGVAYARLVAGLADARVESAGESRVRWCARGLGMDLVPQVEVRDENEAFVARVDFVIAGTNVVVEFDGLRKYTDADVLRAEKRRQMHLERLGWQVVRLCWADLDHPGRVAALLRRAVRRSEKRRAVAA